VEAEESVIGHIIKIRLVT